jgi:hypothetical protein
MRYAIGIGILVVIAGVMAGAVGYYRQKRRDLRQRGTAKRRRIDIPVPSAERPSE